jgi:serine/threonine protein kinase
VSSDRDPSDRAAPGPEGPDPVEDLLTGCLEASGFDAAVERACAAHPEHAAELRRRGSALHRAGLTAAPPAGQDLLQPVQLGPYRLVERLGGGGMGVVWRCAEAPFGREVAVKVARAEHLYVDTARRRFLREVEAVSKLQHPGIVPIYGCGEHGDVPYYAMELVAGRSLGQLLQHLQGQDVRQLSPHLLHVDGRASWTDACCAVIAKVAHALQHAHERSIVHRDVKPSNIMLADDGRVLLIDFGLAMVGGAETVTRPGGQPGSMIYMSPEQVRGDAVDHRTDVWSLGVTLYELLSLRPPFLGDSTEAVRRQILAARPPSLSTSGPRVSWELATILATALAPEPARRYPSAAAFAADLEAALQRRSIAARRPASWLRLRRLAQRHQVLATAAGLLLLLLTMLPMALWIQAQRANREIRREAATAAATVAFLQGLFHEVEPERARGTAMPVRVFVDRGVQRARSELVDQPEVHAALLETLGAVYLDLGLPGEAGQVVDELAQLRADATPVQRVPLLGLQARLCQARCQHARAEQCWRLVLEQAPTPGDDDETRCRARLGLAEALWLQDRLDEAERLFDEVIAELRARRPIPQKALLDALLEQAMFLLARRDALRAEPVFAEIWQLAAQALTATDPQRISIAIPAAGCARSLGDPTRAERLLREALRLAEQILDARHPLRGTLHEHLAEVLLASDRAVEADAEIAQALAVYEAIHEPPHLVLAAALSLRSCVAYELGDFASCERNLTAALSSYEQLVPEGSIEFATVLAHVCRLDCAIGRWRDAVVAGERGVAMARRLRMTGVDQLSRGLAFLAYAHALCGELETATREIDEVLQLCAARPDSLNLAIVLCTAAEVRCFAGAAAAAEPLARRAHAIVQQVGGRANAAHALHVLGWSLELQDRLPEAHETQTAAVQLRRQALGDRHALLALSLSELGVIQARRGEPEAAVGSLAEAVAIYRAATGPSRGLCLPLLNYTAVLSRLGRTADAAPLVLEVADLVDGAVPVGHREAVATAQLMLGLHRKTDGELRLRLAARLHAFVARMLPPDHPVRLQVERAR